MNTGITKGLTHCKSNSLSVTVANILTPIRRHKTDIKILL